MNIKRAQIEISSRCNFKCITCKHGYYEYGQDLPSDICEMLIKDVFPSLKVLELQGTGESLLSDMTEKLVRAAAKNNIEVTMITNGSLLTDQTIELLVSVATQLVISLDGSNSETYIAHRPVGNFDTVIENIRRIIELRKITNSTNFSIVVNMVLTQLNRSDIPNMIKLLSELGVDFLFVSEVRECMPDSKVWSALNLLSESSTSAFKSMISECEDLAKQRGIGFAFNPNIKPNGLKKTVCEAPWKHLFVSSNGDVSVCCELSKIFGNLNKQSLMDILSSEDLQRFQDDMLRGHYDPHCLSCCLPWGLPY